MHVRGAIALCGSVWRKQYGLTFLLCDGAAVAPD